MTALDLAIWRPPPLLPPAPLLAQGAKNQLRQNARTRRTFHHSDRVSPIPPRGRPSSHSLGIDMHAIRSINSHEMTLASRPDPRIHHVTTREKGPFQRPFDPSAAHPYSFSFFASSLSLTGLG